MYVIPNGSIRETLSNSFRTVSMYIRKNAGDKLSVMYLLFTECSYNTDPDKALEYLNTLRDHRIRGNVHWTYLTKDYIYEEMRREYVGEGQNVVCLQTQ